MFSTVDARISSVLKDLLGSMIDIQMGKMQKQVGATDRDLFAIATCTSWANGKDPGEFVQDKLQSHLIQCFESLLFIPFP